MVKILFHAVSNVCPQRKPKEALGRQASLGFVTAQVFVLVWKKVLGSYGGGFLSLLRVETSFSQPSLVLCWVQPPWPWGCHACLGHWNWLPTSWAMFWSASPSSYFQNFLSVPREVLLASASGSHCSQGAPQSSVCCCYSDMGRNR